MTIHVNIGEAKTRFSELCAAALRGEDVIVQKAGVPKLKLVPVESAVEERRAERARKRKAAFGMFEKECEGYDLSLEAFKNLYPDPDDEYRRKFDPAP